MVGLLFKVTTVSFHMWAPNVYEAFLSVFAGAYLLGVMPPELLKVWPQNMYLLTLSAPNGCLPLTL